jgi:hypothetical protein
VKENVTPLAMQAAEVTNVLAIVGRLHDKAKVDRNTLIVLRSLVDRRGRLVGFVELGLAVVWSVIDLDGDRQFGYNSVLVHNGAKGLASQVVEFPSDILIRVVEGVDRRSRIDDRRWLWFDSWGITGLQLAHQVQGGNGQSGSVGATTGSEGATTFSDNGDAGEAVSTAGLGSLAATP